MGSWLLGTGRGVRFVRGIPPIVSMLIKDQQRAAVATLVHWPQVLEGQAVEVAPLARVHLRDDQPFRLSERRGIQQGDRTRRHPLVLWRRDVDNVIPLAGAIRGSEERERIRSYGFGFGGELRDRQILAHQFENLRAQLDEGRRGRAPAQCLDADAAGTSEEVEKARIAYPGRQNVEQRGLDAIHDGTRARDLWSFELAALGRSRDDTHLSWPPERRDQFPRSVRAARVAAPRLRTTAAAQRRRARVRHATPPAQ